MTPDPERYPGVFIHPLAVVDDPCTIGAGTRIWSGALVRNGTKLGKGVSVGVNCALEGCAVGDDTKLNPGVHAGPGIIIGARCFVAGHVVICNDGWPACDPDAYGGWHGCLATTVIIGDDCIIGSNAVILPGTRMGPRSMVAAGATWGGAYLPADHMVLRDGRIKPIDYSRIRRMIPAPTS